MKTYTNISENYGVDCPITVDGYVEVCEANDWDHGEFIEESDGIYEYTENGKIKIAE